VDVEGTHGVLIIRSHEDDGHVGANQFQDIEPGQLGHLHVEENQIGIVFRDGLYSFDAVGAFGSDFDFRMRLQILANDMAR